MMGKRVTAESLASKSAAWWKQPVEMPGAVREQLKDILDGHSTHALRSAYGRLAEAVEELKPVAVPKHAWQEDQKRNRRAATARIEYGPNETLGYAAHRVIPAYSVCHRVFCEIEHNFPPNLSSFTPRSMLDFGSGTGTATLAAVCGAVPEWQHTIEGAFLKYLFLCSAMSLVVFVYRAPCRGTEQPDVTSFCLAP
jgi:ribosomal protein RSM22 (predicted rRNA methylase)